jgi:hypothetical protein
MIDYSTNPPTWAGTNRPVKNAVQAAIKKGLIKEWTEQDERSGYDFRAALIAWGESLKPGDIFTREDWMRIRHEPVWRVWHGSTPGYRRVEVARGTH